MTEKTSNLAEKRLPVMQSLPVRMLAFLSLALLPIGLLAIWQTQSLNETIESRTTQSLVAMTELASSGERQVLQRAIGAAQANAAALGSFIDNDELCHNYFSDFVTTSSAYAFAGFLPSDGMMTCSSAEDDMDLRSTAIYQSLSESQTPQIFPQLEGGISGEDVVVVAFPAFQGGTHAGHIILSILASQLMAGTDFAEGWQPDSLMIFNQNGQPLLKANGGRPPFIPPAERPDIAMPLTMADSFMARDINGELRMFVAVPLVHGLAFAAASWSLRDGLTDPGALVIPPIVFPLLMWMASLLVAYFAVHRLVVRHIRNLRGQMRMFAANRTVPEPSTGALLSQELFELEDSFVGMAYDLLDDEAQMEDALREKNVLLKEIHHRVKNNLQLISSIMNMQIRATKTPETRSILKRLQDRVLGLSTVHRYLYQAGTLGQTHAEGLLKEVFELQFRPLQGTASDVTTQIDADHVVLVPDQAVPLALFAGEVATNAMAQVSPNSQGLSQIRVSLRIVSPGVARLNCTNTLSPNADRAEPTGNLGQQLIKAFAIQLGDTPEIVETSESYSVSVTFKVTQSVPDALDY